MASNANNIPGGFSIDGSGGINTADAVETNVAVWAPATPGAFENARDAKLYTRIGVRCRSSQLKEPLDADPKVSQSFCLTVNNVILVFSKTLEEHRAHVRIILEMLLANDMRADIDECTFDANKCTDAGVDLQGVGDGKVFMVVNTGVPKK